MKQHNWHVYAFRRALQVEHILAFKEARLLARKDGREKAAKRWAKARGYSGAQGGWIYTSNNNPICQGWFGFYIKFRVTILSSL